MIFWNWENLYIKLTFYWSQDPCTEWRTVRCVQSVCEMAVLTGDLTVQSSVQPVLSTNTTQLAEWHSSVSPAALLPCQPEIPSLVENRDWKFLPASSQPDGLKHEAWTSVTPQAGQSITTTHLNCTHCHGSHPTWKRKSEVAACEQTGRCLKWS